MPTSISVTRSPDEQPAISVMDMVSGCPNKLRLIFMYYSLPFSEDVRFIMWKALAKMMQCHMKNCSDHFPSS